MYKPVCVEDVWFNDKPARGIMSGIDKSWYQGKKVKLFRMPLDYTGR